MMSKLQQLFFEFHFYRSKIIRISFVCVTFGVTLSLLGFVFVVVRRYIFKFLFLGFDELLRKEPGTTECVSQVHTNNYKYPTAEIRFRHAKNNTSKSIMLIDCNI